jgi:hypothetical protein
VAAALLTGCGSAPLSSAELRSDANQICRGAQRRADRIATPASAADGAAFLARGIKVLGSESKQLRSLDAGGAAAATLRHAVGDLRRELAELRGAAAAINHGHDPLVVFKRLQAKLVPLETDGERQWQALGIPACSSR